MSSIKISCIWEHNGSDTLLYAQNYPGAYTRGQSLGEACVKMHREIQTYSTWARLPVPGNIETEVTLDVSSSLNIDDADSDVMFPSENTPLTHEEYLHLKQLVLRSAEDFYKLYTSIPDKNIRISPKRNTFYGHSPCTAEEMYQHTKNVNAYYFGEIGIDADNQGTIWECRNRGLSALESKPDFLAPYVTHGSYGEEWSLKKVMRRFLWHDRIHAKAMYRRGIAVFGSERIPDVFSFGQEKQE